MVCLVCGAERDPGTTACSVCGSSPDAPTVAADRIPSSPHTPLGSAHSAGSGIDHGAFTPGTVLASRYRIVGLLGRGGMGEVYRADDLTLGQPVALKFLRGDDPALAARLREETRTARQVSHPNVCRVHDVAEWGGRPFVSMEYIDGEDLASLLRRIGRLPPDKAVEIVRQVCAGLAAAHDRGVLHRDLKPANVMLDARGQVRITDFGLASFADDQRTGEIAGTPAYMAPEQILGGRISPQTDLYAVGLLLFELLAGAPAYGSMSLTERRQQAAMAKPALSPSVRATIDPRILNVIDRCLEPDAARRPESALRLAAALPGGDPLEAALAAGETPAPHVVADATDDTPLTPAAAFACLVAFAAMVVALLAFTGASVYSRFVPFRQSPEVLAARAEEVRQHLGYNDVPEDRAHGFCGPRRLPHVAARADEGSRLTGHGMRAIRPQVDRVLVPQQPTSAEQAIALAVWFGAVQARGRLDAAHPVDCIHAAGSGGDVSRARSGWRAQQASRDVFGGRVSPGRKHFGRLDQTLCRGAARPGALFLRRTSVDRAGFCRRPCCLGRTVARWIGRAVTDRGCGGGRASGLLQDHRAVDSANPDRRQSPCPLCCSA